MMSRDDDDELVSFADEAEDHVQSSDQIWKIVIVDDDADVHQATRILLSHYQFEGRSLEFVSAYSAAEARILLKKHPDVAVILLDVIMEERHSGLDLVKFIREDLNNSSARIVLRTGQPGDFPEEELIIRYDINDYKVKTDVTRENFFSVITTCIRSYMQISQLEGLHEELAEKNKRLEELVENLEEMVAQRTQTIASQNEDLLGKNTELTSLFESKNNLVRILCHDLNNALAVTIGCSQFAKQTTNKHALAKLWDNVEKASHVQLDILDHVREMEAILSGKKKIVLTDVDLFEVVEKARFIFGAKLNAKGLNLDTTAIKKGAFIVRAEQVTLSNSVINNIISNAIKFSHKGSTILVTAKHVGDTVELTVKDSGIGMSSSIQENLFKMDVKTSRKGTDGETGTGFGMPLVKAYLDFYEAKISVESRQGDQEDSGTDFVISFKRA